jgi:hypothetical protein
MLPQCLAPSRIEHAESVLASPPTEDWIDRPDRSGLLVLRAWLPLELCRPRNRQEHGKSWRYARDKERLWSVLRVQAAPAARPLEGRPRVLCCRFSSAPPDAFADWAKAVVDMLCVPKGRARKHRLGYLADDSPRRIDLTQWWEYAPPRQGVCMVEVRRGER